MWKGIEDIFWALSFVAVRPRLWRWFLAPLVISLVLLLGLYFFVVPMFVDSVTGMVDGLPSWLSWLGSGAAVLLYAISAVVGYFLFFVLSAVLTAPFCEMLSEDVESELAGMSSSRFRIGAFVRDLLVGIIHALKRITLYLVTMLGLFALATFVPVIGTAAAAILGVVASARFAAYDALDAVWARKNWRYADKKLFLRSHRSRCFGLGITVVILLAVPLVNLLALPLGAVAATRFALDKS